MQEGCIGVGTDDKEPNGRGEADSKVGKERHFKRNGGGCERLCFQESF